MKNPTTRSPTRFPTRPPTRFPTRRPTNRPTFTSTYAGTGGGVTSSSQCPNVCLEAVPASQCPCTTLNTDGCDLPNCSSATSIGAFCEADSECGTADINNCPQEFDVYRRVACSTTSISQPVPTMPPTRPPTRFPTRFPTPRPQIAVCSFCSSGLSFPDYAAASVDGAPVTCQQLKGESLGQYEGSSLCWNIQSFEDLCCPDPNGISTVRPPTRPPTSPPVTTSSVCSFCATGVDFPGKRNLIRIGLKHHVYSRLIKPSFLDTVDIHAPDWPAASVGGDPVTCQQLKTTSLGLFESSTTCTNIQSFEDECCEAGSGPVCSFCSTGITYPDNAPASIDGEPFTCQQLKVQSTGFFASSAVCANIQSFEDDCCPRVSTTPGGSSSSPCQFCDGGVQYPNFAAASLDDEPVTCQGLKVSSLGTTANSNFCYQLQTFEFLCCPAADRCQFCEKGLKKPDQDLTKDKLDFYLDTKEKYTCTDVAGKNVVF